MKLAVSNIAWENSKLEEHIAFLKELNCDGVEIAPSCIWKEPVTVSAEDIAGLKKMIARHGLVIPAVHALLFTRPDLYLFGEESVRRQMIKYLKDFIRLAADLDARVLVYGSPKSRAVGDKDYKDCYGIAVESFRELGHEAEKFDRFFCIEPLGPNECDFIKSADEGFKLVKDVASPNFCLHLDAKAMINAKEDIDSVFKKYGLLMKHFHVGDPGLAPPGHTGFDHSGIGKSLYDSGYDGFVSIEMKRGFGETRETVRNAVRYVRERYFNYEKADKR
ncbi:MAG: sugar phosphate isomerase/epimerase [Candidatus Omnitrophica bacterium]|nr:sugar phosphate isomerase/epimerase [Candidatus Omnitrophota bacterium]MDD5437258.1 sugar phosphate isomerase/epimerase [Candidatus Omnitrophota bacterium]